MTLKTVHLELNKRPEWEWWNACRQYEKQVHHLCKSDKCLPFSVSVPVSEVIGVKEGRVEIQPQKKVEDTDLDFTCKFFFLSSP